MTRHCYSVLALLLAAPAFAQPDRAMPDTTALVPHWPERFRPSPLLAQLSLSPDSVIARRTSPEVRAEAAIVDPDILAPPDSATEAAMRLIVPPEHADAAMMHDPGPARSPRSAWREKRPAGRR